MCRDAFVRKNTILHSPLAPSVVQKGAGDLLRDVVMHAIPLVPVLLPTPLATVGLPIAAVHALRVSRFAAIGIPFLLPRHRDDGKLRVPRWGPVRLMRRGEYY